MQISIGNVEIHTQIIKIYGVALGVLYYDPNLEPDFDEVPEEEFYSQVTIMFLFVGIHITIWKS
jgi:hypothetical protein